MFCFRFRKGVYSQIVLVVALLSGVSACGGGSGSDNPPPAQTPAPSNTPPIVNAGPDQAVSEGATVQLAGSGSDAEGAVTFAWTQLSGPTVALSNASIAAPTFVAPIVTSTSIVVLRLAVSDAAGAIATDDVSITINDVPPANTPPTVNAGADQTVTEGATVQLAGSGSDAEGAVTLQWSQVSGPTATLSNINIGNPTFVAPQVTSATSIVLRLTATDSAGATAQDTVTITVNDSVVVTGWGTATLIENSAISAHTPRIAMTPLGTAVVVWQQSNRLWGNRYVPGTGWGAATQGSNGVSGDHQVAIDSSGNAMTVWVQYDNTISNPRIWANRYESSSGWAAAELIQSVAADGSLPQIAVNASGNAAAVWQQWNGTGYDIWANRYSTGTGWGTATQIESGSASATSSQVAIDGTGNVLVVWRQTEAGHASIWANRFVAGVGWDTPTVIEANLYTADNPQVAMDHLGNAVAVWEQPSGASSGRSIWANRYVVGVGWGTAARITSVSMSGTSVDDFRLPRLAVNSNGDAAAVWTTNSGSSTVWANKYTAGVGWGTAVMIENVNAENAVGHQVAIDGDGNAIAVWQQSDASRSRIWAVRHVVGTGWSAAATVDSGEGAAAGPQIDSDTAGNALVVWGQSDGARVDIWANRFVP